MKQEYKLKIEQVVKAALDKENAKKEAESQKMALFQKMQDEANARKRKPREILEKNISAIKTEVSEINKTISSLKFILGVSTTVRVLAKQPNMDPYNFLFLMNETLYDLVPPHIKISLSRLSNRQELIATLTFKAKPETGTIEIESVFVEPNQNEKLINAGSIPADQLVWDQIENKISEFVYVVLTAREPASAK